MDILVKNKLEVQDLSKGYDEKGVVKGVLKKISFCVKDGEFLSILGPSGCGKTTLLRILTGLLAPDTGRIIKDGINITDARPHKRGMGIVFQNYALFENMSVLQNVEYALKLNKDTRRTSRTQALEMLEAVGLADHVQKMPKSLSGGQQQRVAIARTLALHPDIVLLDEPMSALDVATRLIMRDELKKLQDKFGTTMIYVTHDQEEAFALSDRIMIMDRGEISQIDTPENIIQNPANDYVKSFVLDNLQAKVDSLARFTKGKRVVL